MRIGLFINDPRTEKPEYATTCLAHAAHRQGHEVWYIGVDDFVYDPDEQVRARARTVPGKRYQRNETFLTAVQEADATRISVSDLDVLLLRNNPTDDSDRPWAQAVGIIFGQIAARHGVVVLNDPSSLANAFNKLYFQFFPPEVRPKTLITRDVADVRAFVKEHEGHVVLKPLQGSGGKNVFIVREEDTANLNQIIEAISRDGYVVVQEYLPAAAEGDTRLFLMNGRPLVCDGKYAAFRRINRDGDVRSNIHAGGEAAPAKIDDRMLEIADIVRPKLVQDGMFLVGLDIAGDKLMEVNVFSPGGLYSMQKFEEADFSGAVIDALVRKVEHVQRYGRLVLGNAQVAMM